MEVQEYTFPDDLLYCENHFWYRPDGDELIMGMNDYAQKMAGEVVYVQLPDDGKKIKEGKKFAKVESGKWLGKIISPFAGVLVAVNEALESDPSLINKDCYGDGWMYKIKPDDFSEVETKLMKADAKLAAFIEEEIVKNKQD